MSNDLVERLRKSTAFYHADCELKMACAARIEELEAKLAKAEEIIELVETFSDRALWKVIGKKVLELKGETDE